MLPWVSLTPKAPVALSEGPEPRLSPGLVSHLCSSADSSSHVSLYARAPLAGDSGRAATTGLALAKGQNHPL